MVRAIYRKLARTWGPQHWWPAETPFEVIAGAILVQNTSWTNAERALASLRSAHALTIDAIRSIRIARLEKLIRSSGYYRQKAQRLKSLVSFVDERYDGSLERMFATPTEELRGQLLWLNGIGHETADAILLYAGNHEIFVVDAYARRILERHAAIAVSARYDEVRALIERALRRQLPQRSILAPAVLPPKLVIHQPSIMSAGTRTPPAQLYNEMHGLLVQIGKHYCLKHEPKCEQCPLRSLLPEAKRFP
jgi:endonuclease-3 related protein